MYNQKNNVPKTIKMAKNGKKSPKIWAFSRDLKFSDPHYTKKYKSETQKSYIFEFLTKFYEKSKKMTENNAKSKKIFAKTVRGGGGDPPPLCGLGLIIDFTENYIIFT